MINSNALVCGRLTSGVAKTVRVPDPVYQRITREAEREDIARGAVVRDWMDKAEKYDEIDLHR